MRLRPSLVWGLLFLALCAISALIPPIQSPDESSHLARAYLISKGQLLLETLPLEQGDANSALPPGSRTLRCCSQGGTVDQSLVVFIDAYLNLARDPNQRMDEVQQRSLHTLEWSHQELAYSLPGAGYYFPAIYFPQALGLAAGRLSDMSIVHTYALVRLLTIGLCIVLLAWAVKLHTPGPLTIGLLTLPMTVFQLASPTIDGLSAALTIFILAGFFKLREHWPKESAPLYAAWLTAIFLVITTRTHMLPLLALPLYLAWHHRSRAIAMLGLVLCASTFSWMAFAITSTVDTRIVRSVSTNSAIAHYLANPLEFVGIVFASLSDSSLSNFYQRSFVGILGWLNVALPAWTYPTLWMGLLVCGLLSAKISHLDRDWPLHLLLLLIASCSIALVFLAMLVTWSPFPTQLVDGVQGRYFLLPGLVASFFLEGAAGQERAMPMTVPAVHAIAATATAGLSVFALTLTLLAQYH